MKSLPSVWGAPEVETVLARRVEVPAPAPARKAPKRSDVAAATRDALAQRLLAALQTAPKGNMRANIARQFGISEDAAAQVIAAECNEIMKYLLKLPAPARPEPPSKSCVVVV